MTDLGSIKYFLGVEVIQDEQGIFISQKVCDGYFEEIWYGRVKFSEESDCSWLQADKRRSQAIV